jgi:hypothetical protein
MKAIDRPFPKIINGSTQFVIPVFQRDYRWTEARCEQLWRDILHVAQNETARGHFIGSVVYVSTGDSSAGFTRWLLIDGQQRLTTLTLLLAAMRDNISATGWNGTEDSPTAARIEAYFPWIEHFLPQNEKLPESWQTMLGPGDLVAQGWVFGSSTAMPSSAAAALRSRSAETSVTGARPAC